MADKRYQGGWDPSYRNFEDDNNSEPIPVLDFDEEDISQLEMDLSAETVVQKGMVETEQVEYFDHKNPEHVYARSGDWHPETRIVQPEIKIEDSETRTKAKLRLLEIYEPPPEPIAKHLAARALSRNGCGDYKYSSTRIFIHEHPILTGIAAVGVTSGLVYALVEYLSK